MGFWSWLKGKTLGGKSVEVSMETLQKYVDQEKMAKLVMEEFTIHAAINLIAPRPVMVNTSSTGSRNGLSVARSGSGI